MRARPTRRQLLAGGAGTALAGGLLAPTQAVAAGQKPQPPESDADRLRRLLSIELLSLYTYQQVVSSSILGPRAQHDLAPLRAHEAAHVRVLSGQLKALGMSPPAPPASRAQANRDLARRGIGGRLGQLQGRRDALFLLLALEQVVVGAYFVALSKLQEPRLVRLAAEIMASHAQHEALIGEALQPGNAQAAVPSGLVQGIQ